MKDKDLVRIRLPVADRQYDFRLPADAEVGQLTQTLISMLGKTGDGPLLLQRHPALWLARNGKPLVAGGTLREHGITDSELLFLI